MNYNRTIKKTVLLIIIRNPGARFADGTELSILISQAINLVTISKIKYKYSYKLI